MSYLGRKGAISPLNSADIPDNSITGAKIVAGTIEASDVAADMATQAELDLKAPLASPAFTGTPTGITAAHITSGALPVGVTGGTGLSGTILATHTMTIASPGYYTSTNGNTWTSTVNYFSFTTNAQTNRLLVVANIRTNAYNSGGDYSSVSNKLAYHDTTNTGEEPDGADVTGQMTQSLYRAGASNRQDVRNASPLTGIVAVSASTAYIIMHFVKYGAGTHAENEEANGYILEYKA